MEKPERLLVSPKEARAIIGCGNTKLYELIKEKRLAVVKLGTKSTRITMDSIKALVSEAA